MIKRKDMEVVFDPASFDNIPLEMPAHLKVQISERDRMLSIIRDELSRQADDAGEDSFGESEDFGEDGDKTREPARGNKRGP